MWLSLATSHEEFLVLFPLHTQYATVVASISCQRRRHYCNIDVALDCGLSLRAKPSCRTRHSLLWRVKWLCTLLLYRSRPLFLYARVQCYLKQPIFSVDKKNQLDVTFCILYFSSNSCSTCFGQPCAHHQELTTALCYSLVLVCAVTAGRLSRPVGR